MTPEEIAQKSMATFNYHVRDLSTHEWLQACEELLASAEAEYAAAKDQLKEEEQS